MDCDGLRKCALATSCQIRNNNGVKLRNLLFGVELFFYLSLLVDVCLVYMKVPISSCQSMIAHFYNFMFLSVFCIVIVTGLTMKSAGIGREKSPEHSSYEGEVEQRLPFQPLPDSDRNKPTGCHNTTTSSTVISTGWERVMQPPPKVRMMEDSLSVFE